MTSLTIYADDRRGEDKTISDYQEITKTLSGIGVVLERWKADEVLPADAEQDTVLAAYKSSIDKLNKQYGFKSVDVVSLRPDNPKKAEMRSKFLAEHIHHDFEIRFFVDGTGLFYLHVDGKVYLILCEAGDLISVPANTTHWFDMGENPSFKCIRFFTTENGWVGDFTGNDIAMRFPSYDEHCAALV